jgi:outer membrane protein, heavy metal efflux system
LNVLFNQIVQEPSPPVINLLILLDLRSGPLVAIHRVSSTLATGNLKMVVTTHTAFTFRALILALAALTTFAFPVNANELTDSIVPHDPVLTSLLDEMAIANPSVAEMRERLTAAQARATQAGTWMDPKLAVGAMNLPSNNPFDLNQEPMTGLWVNASQSIPLNSKYDSRREAAEAMVDATRQQIGLRTASISAAVRSAWYDWAYLLASVATVDTTIQLVDELLAITRTKYETGKGLQSDLLRLQTERSRLASQRLELDQNARNAGRRIATLLGREPDKLPDAPGELPDEFPKLDRGPLKSAVDDAPQVALAREMLRAKEARMTLSKQMWLPELMLGGGYGYRMDADNGMDRADFISITAGITLPVFGKNKQSMAVEEAVAEKRSAEHALRESTLDVNRRFESLLDEDARHQQQIQLYDEGILPQANAAFSSTLSDYSYGRVGVEALVSTERQLINSRLQRLMHMRDRAKVRAALASLIETTNLND